MWYANAHRTFVTGKWHLLFLMEHIFQTQSIVKTRRFNLLKIKELRFPHLEGFIFYACQRREGRPKQMQLSWFLRFLTDFRFVDFRIIRISAFPVFRISGFLHFRFGVSTCIRPRRAGWMEGLFEVVVLKFQFSDPKWNLLNWCSDSRPNSHLWKVVLPSYLARNVTQFHLFGASDCQHGRFKYGRIPAASKLAHLLQFYVIWHLRDWNMAQFVSNY